MPEMLLARLTCMRVPWANTIILASVPSDAGKYRFVRVIRVLIFPGAPELCWFCVAA